MNGKNILGMAAILLVMQMFVGISLACNDNCNDEEDDQCPDCNMLSFYNQINATGDVQVYQEGSKDVSLTNNIEVRSGSLDFTQLVNSGEWKLTNKAYLEGGKVTFQGVTIGAEDCTDCSSGEIKFNQHIRVEGILDPWSYQKLENEEGTTILEQKVDIYPGGWMDIDQSGYVCGDCEQGFLAQEGWMHGRDMIAWQAGLVDGNTGYNEVKSTNWANGWLDFNQVVSFNMN